MLYQNGDIKTLNRNGTTTGGGSIQMDQLAYSYKVDINTGERKNNQLDQVDGAELQSQNAYNYDYDASGRLIEDVKEKLRYEYNTQGLVKGVKST